MAVVVILLASAWMTVTAGFEGEFAAYEIEVDGLERYFIVYTPTEGDNLPVVLDFHGWGGTAEAQAQGSGLLEVAEEEGFIVVYPQALEENTLLWSPAADTPYVQAVLDVVEQDYNVDETRIYAVGFSGGAFMTHYLGGALSDQLAAIATLDGYLPDFPAITEFGGLLPEALETVPDLALPPEPVRPVPVQIIHGIEDTIVPYDGIAGTIAIWTAWNGCDPTPEQTELNASVTVDVYADCDEDARVELYTFSTGEDEAHGYGLDDFIDMTTAEVMWGFLSQYSLD